MHDRRIGAGHAGRAGLRFERGRAQRHCPRHEARGGHRDDRSRKAAARHETRSRWNSRLFVAVSGLPKCPPTVPDEECAKLERDLKADGIAVVDTATHKVVKVLAAGSDPEQFVISADGKRLFVANEDAAQCRSSTSTAAKIIARIPVGREPEGVGIVARRPLGPGDQRVRQLRVDHRYTDAEGREISAGGQAAARHRVHARQAALPMCQANSTRRSTGYRVPDGEPVERVLQLRKEARPMAVVLDPPRNRLVHEHGTRRHRGGGRAEGCETRSRAPEEVPVGTRPWGIALSQDGR